YHNPLGRLIRPSNMRIREASPVGLDINLIGRRFTQITADKDNNQEEIRSQKTESGMKEMTSLF
ncbi:MAG: hypothetical protein OEW45_01075, partial [Deltaproteobacteria bacterium]|nr:hypothetical protein [Deltaproteobacteria bacterium]